MMLARDLPLILLAMVCGSACYTAIAIFAARRFRRNSSPPANGFTPPITVVKPLCGIDRGLEANLESFFRQDYPSYEIVFAVRDESDAAVPVVRRLQEKYRAIPARLLLVGPSRYLNAKVHAMEEILRVARHDVLVISDSDVRVSGEYLRSVVAPLADPGVGMVTCLSRGVPANTVWSLLEALGINTQFLAGVLSAWLLIGMEFSLGPTMVIRKRQVEEIGGVGVLGDYLADDFVLGELVARAGKRVVLSDMVPDHLFGGESMKDSLSHRLRWERSSRCSRPAGYLGQIFTHTIPLVIAAWAALQILNPLAGPALHWFALSLFGLTLGARALLAWEVGLRIMRDANVKKYWWLLPIQDLLSFAIWLWAFFGNEIVWRGVTFRVLKGGKLQRVKTAAPDRPSVDASREAASDPISSPK
jgi:ceramide glucosyltransferase